MTVADLIALLNDMPADALVLVDDSDWGRHAPFVDLDDGDVVLHS